MKDNEPKAMHGFGGIFAWIVIFCLIFALGGGHVLKGCADGINAYGNGMRTMAGADQSVDGDDNSIDWNNLDLGNS